MTKLEELKAAREAAEDAYADARYAAEADRVGRGKK